MKKILILLNELLYLNDQLKYKYSETIIPIEIWSKLKNSLIFAGWDYQIKKITYKKGYFVEHVL